MKVKIELEVKNKEIESGKTAHLAIGTNKGNKEENIKKALNILNTNPSISIVQISHAILNPPKEGLSGEDFLNGAFIIRTSLKPFELLEECKKVEKELGRENNTKDGYKPRVIDLDILLFEGVVLVSDDLEIPHPRMHKRDFVLEPLCEIAPDIEHPTLRKTISFLKDKLRLRARN